MTQESSIVVAIDFTSADSYLAIDPVIDLAIEYGFDLQFQPFRVRTVSVPVESANESDSQRHKRIKAEYQRMDTTRYATIRGLELLADPVGVDPTLSHLGLILATDHCLGVKYSQSVLRKFWKGELNLEDEREIVSILEALGIELVDPLDRLQPRLAEIHSELMNSEVFAVPTFFVKGERFIGRQHLPMIRWLLNGEGPLPI